MNEQSEIAIRPFRPSDFEAIVDIANCAWAPIFAGYRRQLGDEMYGLFFDHPSQEKREQLRRKVAENPEQILIAECGGKIAGFVTFSLSEELKAGILTNNAVSPDFQNRGVAQTMYSRVFELFREAGMRIALVNTGADEMHTPARRAYQKAGFSLSTESITYYRKL